MKILLSAYACEPGKGSEPEVGWLWAIGLADRGHDVWVITRANNRSAIEAALVKRPRPNLHFHYFDLAPALLRLKRWMGTNVYYYLWQRRAKDLAAQLHSVVGFDLGHHVTFVVIRHPSFLEGLGVPYIFGPVSGGDNIPLPLLRKMPLRVRLAESFRLLVTRFMLQTPAVKRTLENAKRIVVTSEQTGQLLPKSLQQKVSVRLAISAPDTWQIRADPRTIDGSSPVKLLFVGRLIPLKGVEFALEAVGKLLHEGRKLRFTIVGEGPERPKLQQLAQSLRIEQFVDYLPWLPRDGLEKVYDDHDILLFPSLRDSGGMVVLEAMRFGLPVVCVNVGGPGVMVTADCGRAISAGDHGQTISLLAKALAGLIDDPTHYANCSRGALARVSALSDTELFRALGY